MSNEVKHIIPYGTYLLILAILIVLTLLSVAITSIELREYTIIGALAFAAIKTFLVLYIFMHLKYEQPMYRRMAFFVIILVFVVLAITFIDYIYR